MVNVRHLTSLNDTEMEEIIALLIQQSPAKRAEILRKESFSDVFENPNFKLFAAFDGNNIIGMGSMFYQQNLTGWIAEIHDTVVLEKYRRRGIGEQVVRALISETQQFAQQKNIPIMMSLTSNRSRVAANNLYQKLGFTLVARPEGRRGVAYYRLFINS